MIQSSWNSPINCRWFWNTANRYSILMLYSCIFAHVFICFYSVYTSGLMKEIFYYVSRFLKNNIGCFGQLLLPECICSHWWTAKRLIFLQKCQKRLHLTRKHSLLPLSWRKQKPWQKYLQCPWKYDLTQQKFCSKFSLFLILNNPMCQMMTYTNPSFHIQLKCA